MNRRGFISQLALMLGAASGPGILALKAHDHFRWRAGRGGLIAVINPEWVNAPYEIRFLWAPGDFIDAPTPQFIPPYPARFRTVEDALECQNMIPPFIFRGHAS